MSPRGACWRADAPTLVMALALVGPLTVAGCSAQHPVADPVPSGEATLVGGAVPTTAEVPEIAAVGRFTYLWTTATGAGSCSATLIAPRLMITAAHCARGEVEGCRQPVKDGLGYVRFANANGNPNGLGSLERKVVGIALHPAAYGDRLGANCASEEGLDSTHDLALLYLDATSADIPNIPVLTTAAVRPFQSPYDARLEDFTPWIRTGPLVTVFGYGQGTKPEVTRDMGTVGLGLGSDRWTVQSIRNNPVSLVKGDSGGPLLFGRGPVVPGVPLPGTLPSGARLVERRYLVGVASQSDGERAFAASLFNPANAQWLANRWVDFDGDGVGDERDNCLAVANPDQTNCNADAESDRSGAVLGDACDPNPCPFVNIESKVTGPRNACELRPEIVVRNSMHLTPAGSHNPSNGVLVADRAVSTRFRFCQPDPTRGVTCSIAGHQRDNAAFDEPNPNGYVPGHWLPMTFFETATDPAVQADYPSNSPVSLVWDYNGDRKRWSRAGLIREDNRQLEGVLGVRADSALGSNLRNDNGVHASPGQHGIPPGAAMARFYTELAPEFMTLRGAECREYDPEWWRWCPMCTVDLPRFTDCPMCGVHRLPSDDWWRGRRLDPVVVLPGLRGRWGILDDDGGFLLPPSVLSPGVLGELGSDEARFIARAEVGAVRAETRARFTTPSDDPGVPAPIQGVFVSLDGTTLLGVVRATTRGYHLDGEAFTGDPADPETLVSVAVPNGATLSTLALGTLGGPLRIEDRAAILTSGGGPAPVAAVLGPTEIGANARVGSVFSSGDVELRDRARVDGLLVTDGGVRLSKSSVVTGTISEHTPTRPLDVSWTANIPAPGEPIMVEPDHARTLPPGSYASVHVKSRATLSLGPGSYFFDSLSVEPQGIVDAHNGSGPVYVYLREGLVFRGRIAERAPAVANLLFVARGEKPIRVEAPFRGALVAPNALLRLGTVRGGEHVGSFFARSIEVAPDVTVRHRPFTRPDCEDAGGCLGGWEQVATSRPTTTDLGVSPRYGFAAVLGARLQSLFLIGGDSPTGHPTGQVLLHRLDLGTTETLEIPGYTPGEVLAAAANIEDSSVWVLDRVVTAGRTALRLARVDPLTRRHQNVWEGAATRAYDAHWLTSGTDGGVVLFSSSRSLGRHATIRLTTSPFVFGSARFELLRESAGTLAGQPVPSSSGGFSYLLNRADGLVDRVHVPHGDGVEIQDVAPWL